MREGTALTERCVFCGNDLTATEDATLDGLPDYVRNTGSHIPVPTAMQSKFDAEPVFDVMDILQPDRSHSSHFLGMAASVVGVLLVLGWLLHRCGG